MAKVSVGDKVKTTAEYDVNGTHLASFVRTNTYDVIQVGGKNLPDTRVVIGKGKAVTAAVHIDTLTKIGGTSTPAVTPPVPAPSAPKQTMPTNNSNNINASGIAIKLMNKFNNTGKKYDVTTIDGSKVQYSNERYDADMSDDYKYAINKIIEEREKKDSLKGWINDIERKEPSIIQNRASVPFPKLKKFNSKKGYYIYDYYQDYNKDKLSNTSTATVYSDMNAIRKSLNLDVMTRQRLISNYTSKYNKFKVDNPNDRLSKTFAHVFFVRPDCNIFKEGSNGRDNNIDLIKDVENLSEFYYAKKHCPEVLRQLTQKEAGYDNEFMFLLSNKARSFQIADEYITSDTYGTGLTGYKIPYGKDNVESRTAKTFSINYIDDRDLHVYNLHKLWIDYISYVFRGKLVPRDIYNLNKIIDYATCVYYIVCAEDGETIIFWSKYWGVFPTEAPSSSFSYSADNGNTMHDPELSIEYQYAWKEDFNPLSMIEFNMHSNKNYNYINNYQNSKLGTGYTWSGSPFVETFNNNSIELPYTFKLRFRPE